jgi:hypothetical protein
MLFVLSPLLEERARERGGFLEYSVTSTPHPNPPLKGVGVRTTGFVPPPLGRRLGGGTPAIIGHPESLTPTLSLMERE